MTNKELSIPQNTLRIVKTVATSLLRVWYFVIVYMWIYALLPFMTTIYSGIHSLFGLSNDELADNYAHHAMYQMLGINHLIERDAELIETGFCISNHRCFLDCLIEPYLSKSCLMIRGMCIVVVPFVVLFTYVTNVMLMVNRGVDHRDAVYEKCANFLTASKDAPKHCYQRRVSFYPEGTRMSYTDLKSEDDLRSKLKFGLLRSIYEAKQYPVQITISSNKDLVISEKWLSAQYGVTVRSVISKPIHPKDYTTMEAFFDEIVQTWYRCYRRTHDTTGVADSLATV